MYLLVRTMTGQPFAAAIAGFVYAFALPRIAQLNHMQLLSMQWTPLIILLLFMFMRSQKLSLLAGFGALSLLQILCSLYIGYLSLLIVTCYLIGLAIMRRDLFSVRVLRNLTIAAALGALVILPIGRHYQKWQRSAWFSETTLKAGAIGASADPRSSYLQVAGFPHHIYRHLLQRFNSSEVQDEKVLFMGFVPMTLALIGTLAGLRLRRKHPEPPTGQPRQTLFDDFKTSFRLGSILTVVCAYILSLGPYLRIHDQPTQTQLPYRLLQEVLPGLGSFRVPARFGLAVLFGVAVLAALGFSAIIETIPIRYSRAVRVIGLMFAIAMMSLEFYGAPIGLAAVMAPSQVAPEYQWLASRPAGAVTLELPMSRFAPYASDELPDPFEQAGYVFASVYHWQPLMDGYTGNPPAAFLQTLRLGRQLPEPSAVEGLSRLGMHFVVVHFDHMPAGEMERWRQKEPASGLHEIVHFQDGAVIYETETNRLGLPHR